MRNINHLRICISHECNLKCKHCYNAQLCSTKYEDLLQALTPIERIKSFIGFLIDELGLKKISITGGEPLFSKVWPRTKEILSSAVDHDLDIQFNTNGAGDVDLKTLLPLIKDIKDKFFLHVSLDGIKSSFVESLRGREKVLGKIITFVKNAVSNQLIVRIRYTITKENAFETVDSYKYISNLGVKAFLTKPIFPSGNALNNHQLYISRDSIRRIQLDLLEASINNPTRLHFPQPVFFNESDIPEGANTFVQQCNCGSHAVYLSQTGDVFPCTYMVGIPENQKYIIGNIQQMNFNEFRNLWLKPSTFTDFRNIQDICPSYEIATELFEK